MNDFFDFISAIFLVLVLTFISALIGGVIVMFLWNWLMPVIFGLPVITFLQAWGLTWLCSILFKSHTSNSKS